MMSACNKGLIVKAVANCNMEPMYHLENFVLTFADSANADKMAAGGTEGFTFSNMAGMFGPAAMTVKSVTAEGADVTIAVDYSGVWYMSSGTYVALSQDNKQRTEFPAFVLAYDNDGLSFNLSATEMETLTPVISDFVSHDEDQPGTTIQYYLYSPENAEGKLPLVIFLHGNDNAGHNPGKPGTQVYLDYTPYNLAKPASQAKYGPMYVMAPTSRQNQETIPLGWFEEEITQVRNLAQGLVDAGKVDPSRIYLCGESLGGMGSWRAACQYPDFWAAVMPCAGNQLFGGDQSTWAGQFDIAAAAASLGRLPIRFVHAISDFVVPIEFSVYLYDGLKAAGANVSHTWYADRAPDGSAQPNAKGITADGVLADNPMLAGYSHFVDIMIGYDEGLLDWLYSQKKD
jgi:predicted peptidase